MVGDPDGWIDFSVSDEIVVGVDVAWEGIDVTLAVGFLLIRTTRGVSLGYIQNGREFRICKGESVDEGWKTIGLQTGCLCIGRGIEGFNTIACVDWYLEKKGCKVVDDEGRKPLFRIRSEKDTSDSSSFKVTLSRLKTDSNVGLSSLRIGGICRPFTYVKKK